MNTTKHIQTEIDMDVYDHLMHLSRLRNISLKETIREAVVEYIRQHEDDVEHDPFFNIVESFETREGNWSERDDWRE